jgi:hypothetical protein
MFSVRRFIIGSAKSTSGKGFNKKLTQSATNLSCSFSSSSGSKDGKKKPTPEGTLQSVVVHCGTVMRIHVALEIL